MATHAERRLSVRVPEVKVVLLGETGTGKSSLLLRFVRDDFRVFSESTIGAAFLSRKLMVKDGEVKLQIWDTAGQEKYHSLAPMYYRNASAAVVVFDITSAPSFDRLQGWVEELRARGPEDLVLAIAGNKSDLAQGRAVEVEEAKAYAESIGAPFFETSAKTGSNVTELFADLCERVEPPPPANDFQFAVPLEEPAQGCCS